MTPDAGCAGYTVTVSGICGGGGSPTPTPPHPRAYQGHPTAQPVRGRQVPRIRQRSCVMASPRLPLTSTCLVVWIMAPPRAPLTVWISPLETGNLARRCHSAVKRLPVRSTQSTGIAYCADGFATNAFAAYDINTDTWTPLAPDPFVADHYGSASGAFNGKVYVVGGTSGFSNAVWIYDIATNSWSLGTSAPTGPFLLAGYHAGGSIPVRSGRLRPELR